MSVGAQLQRARTEQQRSLADVSHATKIQPWVLEALEADRLQDQMSPIYVKGFLAQYAKFLHLDAESLSAQLVWPQVAQPEEPSAPQPLPAPSWSLPSFSLPLRPIWLFLKRVRPLAAATLAVAALILINPLRWLPAISFAHRQASVTVMPEPVAPIPSLETVKLLPVEPLELAVTVHRSTWVRVRVDGKLLSQQRLPRGANELWKAKKRLELVIAKPLQVDLYLNGQPITPLAVSHHGRLLITHDGISRLPEDEL
jgi:hypothetical protein